MARLSTPQRRTYITTQKAHSIVLHEKKQNHQKKNTSKSNKNKRNRYSNHSPREGIARPGGGSDTMDEKGKYHVMEIMLSQNYPEDPPSINSDLPYIPKIKWSITSRLINVINQFCEHLKKLQVLWSTLECIDSNLSVIGTKDQLFGTTLRHISLCEDCSVLLHINPCNPNTLPECRFLGSDQKVDKLLKNWKKNSRNWKGDKAFHENLATILETELPQPPTTTATASQKGDETMDCGICYAQYLPIDEELGSDSGCASDNKCENTSCMRAFHTVCLRDWLRTITTTRQSFDVLFGNCPYCSEPVAVKITG